MCYITATEFKKNLGHYMELSLKEDVYVTKNNKLLTCLTNPENKKFDSFMKMRGCLGNKPEDYDYESILEEEIIKHAYSR